MLAPLTSWDITRSFLIQAAHPPRSHHSCVELPISSLFHIPIDECVVLPMRYMDWNIYRVNVGNERRMSPVAPSYQGASRTFAHRTAFGQKRTLNNGGACGWA